MDYKSRQVIADMRRVLRSARRGIPVSASAGSPAARDNAGMGTGRGQISEIYDVRNADGTIGFALGITGLTDGVMVE